MPSKFTIEDHKLIARALRKSLRHMDSDSGYYQWFYTVQCMANMFALDNVRFDKEKFIQDCKR